MCRGDCGDLHITFTSSSFSMPGRRLRPLCAGAAGTDPIESNANTEQRCVPVAWGQFGLGKAREVDQESGLLSDSQSTSSKHLDYTLFCPNFRLHR